MAASLVAPDCDKRVDTLAVAITLAIEDASAASTPVPSVSARLLGDGGSLPAPALGVGVGAQLAGSRWLLELTGALWGEQHARLDAAPTPDACALPLEGLLVSDLTPLRGLRTLQRQPDFRRIGGTIRIAGCDQLVDRAGLENLTAWESLSIDGMANLATLAGLQSSKRELDRARPRVPPARQRPLDPGQRHCREPGGARAPARRRSRRPEHPVAVCRPIRERADVHARRERQPR